ncbi:alpha-amylase family glycosyl hydrolase [Arthrobacter sp. Br18]|uniref:alpha-amylase family glycosyl hydrolase n=1 Tax=Arthrobacter sp. Br18 TaxID=1312954 RepID=UPI00047AECF7|nr:alpha-amylase family glycosyl hydrolase [Arthrobacter sp. Br18]
MLTALVTGSVLAPPALAAPQDPQPPSSTAASATEQHSLRSAVTDENFYFVMADRFQNGTALNDDGGLGSDPLVSGFDPTRKGFFNGGDLKGLKDQLDYIEGLGTTSIWLTPSFKNRAVQPEDGSAGYHGYWITDFTQIDPHLGSNDDLKALIDAAHARGMKVYFDIITNHTADVIGYDAGERAPYISKDEEPYRDAEGNEFDDRDFAGTGAFPALDAATSFPYVPMVPEADQALKVPEWLNDPTLYHNRGDTTFAGEDAYYGDFFGLDDLSTEHPRVVSGMADIYKTWIADFGVDGFRIDTMKHVNDEFWQDFGPEVLSFAQEQGKDEFFMFGEVFDTSKAFTSQFTTRNRMQSVLDFPFQSAARGYASQGAPATDLESFFAGDDWYTDADSNAYSLPTFLGNHDMGRIGSFIAADNPGAPEDEILARDTLAHELMYFARGNPVIYYGDEQGFTGPGGDQDARQTMFASQVGEYLDDDLLGTESTHAVDNFDTTHPLYTGIKSLAEVTAEHPALRNGAHQHRYAADGPGIYAFSRIDAGDQREYVVALNNSTEPQTASIPTYAGKRSYGLVYGDAADRVKSAADGTLPVTVPALSAVVYEASGRTPHSKEAPAVTLQEPLPAPEDNGRMKVAADVDGSSFYEVSFEARTTDGVWTNIGTDDNAPYGVYHDVSGFAAGEALEYRAVVLDNADHTRTSGQRSASVPAPKLSMNLPVEGSRVQDDVDVTATVSPERSDYAVTLQRSVAGGEWTAIGADDSSPTYTAVDDLTALNLGEGTEIRYRAVLDGSVSDLRTVTVGSTVDQPDTVAVAGSLDSELGCGADWDPTCDQAQMRFDEATQLWILEVADLPAGTYDYKAALNRSWTENYGAGGGRDGSNISYNHVGGPVRFVYDHRTHLIGTE